MKRWKQGQKRKVFETKLFDVHEVEYSSLTSKRAGTFDVLETTDWVNVVALTPDKNIIMVKQFRYGIGDITLEFPAGKVDPGEEPRDAARRELKEETGGLPDELECFGKTQANPAFLNNHCHHFIATDVELHEAPDLDGHEEIDVKCYSIAEVDALIASGYIAHSLSICAWFYFKQARSL